MNADSKQRLAELLQQAIDILQEPEFVELSTTITFTNDDIADDVVDGDNDRQIEEGSQWSLVVSATGGVEPYTITVERERESDGITDITEAAIVMSESVTFSSGGKAGNTGMYRVHVTDAQGSEHTSTALNLEVIVESIEVEEPEEEYEPVPYTAPQPAPAQTLPEIGIGGWGEDRNAISPCPDIYGDPDEPVPANMDPHGWGQPVMSILDNSTFAHIKVKTLADSGADDVSYVVNMINEARARGCRMDLTMVNENDIGHSTATGEGFYDQSRTTGANGLERYKNKIDEYYNDPDARQAINEGIADGTVRYIFTLDEPNHKRWSKSGNAIVVSSQDVDDMAEHVKSRFPNAQTIVRTSALNLMFYCGDHVFQHLTHAYLTISSNKWTNGNAAEGLERWLTRRPWTPKGGKTQATGEIGAYIHANLKMALMVQAGFESKNAHPDGSGAWSKDEWWPNGLNLHLKRPDGSVRTAAEKPYQKCSPWEMEWWIKSILTLRNSGTGVIDPDGIRFCNDVVYFRMDRRKGGAGTGGTENWWRRPHIVEHYELMQADIAADNLVHSAHPKIQVGMDQ